MKISPLEKVRNTKRKKAPRQAGLLDIMRGASCLDYVFLLLGVVFSLVNGAILPLNSLVFQGMADTLITGERNHSRNELDMDVFTTNVLLYCGLYLGLGFALLAIGYISNASLYTLCERRIHSIRARYLRAVLRQDMTWLDQQQTGALTMKMSSGMERIKDGIGDKLGLILASIGSFIGGISLGFYLSWRMTLVMLITVPLLIGATQFSGKVGQMLGLISLWLLLHLTKNIPHHTRPSSSYLKNEKLR
ncbi:unnamed protein product [Haemonchus placei]|uniref:ABC transmembrane type-1 domain-containing protein n=1 Tax=Haemonchus placei TaxID=6290 RepID=A0A0N4W974_HAEPC|nr:unnamed protein product [Haemonchus placei]